MISVLFNKNYELSCNFYAFFPFYSPGSQVDLHFWSWFLIYRAFASFFLARTKLSTKIESRDINFTNIEFSEKFLKILFKFLRFFEYVWQEREKVSQVYCFQGIARKEIKLIGPTLTHELRSAKACYSALSTRLLWTSRFDSGRMRQP